MGRSRKPSLRSRAAHLVSDFTTIILNPISDKPSSSSEDKVKENVSEDPDESDDVTDSSVSSGPDTSSFGAFLVSLLSSSSESTPRPNEESNAGSNTEMVGSILPSDLKENVPRKSMFSRGKQSIGKVMLKAARMGGYRYSKFDPKVGSPSQNEEAALIEQELIPLNGGIKQPGLPIVLPDISEPSLLLSESMRNALYVSLPIQVKDRNWVLLYSTWRHGISLATLYRRSLLCPGQSLLVVGDQKGAVFGGLVEAPLRPSNKKYQGSNCTFVFTNLPNSPAIFRPTGANRYFTLCSGDFLALGGGGHFALYLDGELLTGSSSASETFGNPCLAHTNEFDVKEVELWGFVYASKYEETLEMCRTEAPGICRW